MSEGAREKTKTHLSTTLSAAAARAFNSEEGVGEAAELCQFSRGPTATVFAELALSSLFTESKALGSYQIRSGPHPLRDTPRRCLFRT